jgi:hypothetical protein
MLHEYHAIYSVRYYPWFYVTAVGLGTYYPWIRGHTCIARAEIFLFFHAAFTCNVFRPLCLVTAGSWHSNNDDKRYAVGLRRYSVKY